MKRARAHAHTNARCQACDRNTHMQSAAASAAACQEKKIVEQPQMSKVDLARSSQVTCTKYSSNASSKEAVKSTASQVTCTKDSSNAYLVRAGQSGDVGVRREDVVSTSLVVSIYV